MALNTRVTLYIRTVTSQSDTTMTFYGLQLGTVYNQIMQNCFVHFPEDEARNEDMSDMRETTYMGLSHIRDNIIRTHRPVMKVCHTYSFERDTDTFYFLRADVNQENQDDNDSVVVSIASAESIDEQECDPHPISQHELSASG